MHGVPVLTGQHSPIIVCVFVIWHSEIVGLFIYDPLRLVFSLSLTIKCYY